MTKKPSKIRPAISTKLSPSENPLADGRCGTSAPPRSLFFKLLSFLSFLSFLVGRGGGRVAPERRPVLTKIQSECIELLRREDMMAYIIKSLYFLPSQLDHYFKPLEQLFSKLISFIKEGCFSAEELQEILNALRGICKDDTIVPSMQTIKDDTIVPSMQTIEVCVIYHYILRCAPPPGWILLIKYLKRYEM